MFKNKASDLLWLRYQAPADNNGVITPPAGTSETVPPITPVTPATPANGPNSGKTFTQAELDQHIKDRLDREKETAKNNRLKEEQKFKELSEQQSGQLLTAEKALQDTRSKLADLEAMVQKYKTALESSIADRMKGIPDPVKDLLKDKDPVDQIDWLSKNADKVATVETPKGGPPATPKPQGQQNSSYLDQWINRQNETGSQKQ